MTLSNSIDFTLCQTCRDNHVMGQDPGGLLHELVEDIPFILDVDEEKYRMEWLGESSELTDTETRSRCDCCHWEGFGNWYKATGFLQL